MDMVIETAWTFETEADARRFAATFAVDESVVWVFKSPYGPRPWFVQQLRPT